MPESTSMRRSFFNNRLNDIGSSVRYSKYIGAKASQTAQSDSRGKTCFYSSSRNTRNFNHEIREQSEIWIHREYNLALHRTPQTKLKQWTSIGCMGPAVLIFYNYIHNCMCYHYNISSKYGRQYEYNPNNSPGSFHGS